jgi:hypothetical protein
MAFVLFVSTFLAVEPGTFILRVLLNVLHLSKHAGPGQLLAKAGGAPIKSRYVLF